MIPNKVGHFPGDNGMKTELEMIYGILLPFFGTSLGAGCVFFMRKSFRSSVQIMLNGFAAGVMVAASVWSLLIPAMEQTKDLGKWGFLPALIGLWIGILCLLFLDKKMPQVYMQHAEKDNAGLCKKKTMLVLAVTVHNIPEGMAVGVAFAGWISHNTSMTMAGAFALSIGIAVQNFPEGAIVSLPLCAGGMHRRKAFGYGVLSGAVEPAAAFVTICAAGLIVPALPYLLSFAAGAMLYVVIAELIPELDDGKSRYAGVIFFAIGFSVMMILDVTI